MSAQGPAPGRIGKRKGAGGVGAMNWELPERGSARARCVLGWGVLTWARPLDSDSAKRSDARRVWWHRVGYRAPLGALRGTLSTARGDDSQQPALSALESHSWKDQLSGRPMFRSDLEHSLYSRMWIWRGSDASASAVLGRPEFEEGRVDQVSCVGFCILGLWIWRGSDAWSDAGASR